MHTSKLVPPRLLLAKQARYDIARVRFFQLVIYAIIPADTDKEEGLDDGINTKAHPDEPVHHRPRVSLVPTQR